MNPLDRRAFLIALSSTVAACTSPLGGGSPPQLYTLTPAKDFPANLPSTKAQLLIEAPAAPGGLDTERIALMRTAVSLDYFAGAAWTDRAPLMVQSLLIESFENTGKVAAIDRESIALRADYILKTDFRDFTAIYGGSGVPVIRVRLGLKLVHMPDRQIVAQHNTSADEPAQENSIMAVVQAFDTALHRAVVETVGWALPVMTRA
jgi:cholesterol transport system auxiliary component